MILIKRYSSFKKFIRMNLKYERVLLQRIKEVDGKVSNKYRVKLSQINDLKNE